MNKKVLIVIVIVILIVILKVSSLTFKSACWLAVHY